MSDVAARAIPPRDPTRPWAPSPFTRLARTHAGSVAGDAIFTTAMAGTVFFSANSLDEARSRVALTLLFTIAPFAVAAPLIGPLVDRAKGGRRWMIIVIAALRAVVSLLLIRHYDTWLLYPEGLLMLVLSKGHLIARGAIVPTVVRSDEELVRANAKLALLGGITTAVAVVPAGILLKLGGPGWVLGLGVIAFVVCTVLAFDLPKTRVAAEPAGEEEKAELRSIGILLAASAMGIIRGVVGFLAFLIAFYAKDNDLPALLAVGAVAGQAGFLAGAVAAPMLRRHVVEERILTLCLGFIMATAVVVALLLGAGASTVQIAVGLGLISLVVGQASNVAKQAFDAIVQRDAPDANRGRSFARFETRFQLVWVVGALVPTALGLPLQAAMVLIAGVTGFALVSYLVGFSRAQRGLDHRIIRLRRRPDELADDEDEAGTDPAALGFAIDDDATAVMAVPARRPRRRRTPSTAPIEDPASVDASMGVAAPVGLLGIADPDPTMALDDVPPSGLFAPLPADAPDASDVDDRLPSAPPIGYEAGGHGPLELFDGAAALEEDHRQTAVVSGELDAEPEWGAALGSAASSDAPSDPSPSAVPAPVVVEPPDLDGWALDAPPASTDSDGPATPPPAPPVGSPAPPTPSPVGPPVLDDEPRWRDVTTPHLPGFEPGPWEAVSRAEDPQPSDGPAADDP